MLAVVHSRTHVLINARSQSARTRMSAESVCCNDPLNSCTAYSHLLEGAGCCERTRHQALGRQAQSSHDQGADAWSNHGGRGRQAARPAALRDRKNGSKTLKRSWRTLSGPTRATRPSPTKRATGRVWRGHAGAQRPKKLNRHLGLD